MPHPTPKRPVLVFFQEAKPGDILKQKAESNVADTGGGARDLRIRPADKFVPIISRMFPNQGPQQGVVQGPVHSEVSPGSVVSKTVEFWRPTDARPGEARIARIHEIEGWRIDEGQFNADLGRHKKTFYLLVQDKDGVVWARTLREQDLSQQDQKAREYIERRIRKTATDKTVRGSIDFETGRTYPD